MLRQLTTGSIATRHSRVLVSHGHTEPVAPDPIAVPVWHKLVLTSREAGALVGRDPKTIAGLCELGVIHAARDKPGGLWRIPRTSLERWIELGQPLGL